MFLFIQPVFAENLSETFSKAIKTRRFWVSGTYSYAGDKIPVSIIQKKWMVSGEKMVEITQNSVLDSSSGAKQWMSEEIDLNKVIQFNRIATFPMQNPTIKILTKEAFAIATSQSIVIFRSSNSANKLLPPTVGAFNHMWAPVAYTIADMGIQSAFDPLPNVPHKFKTALRHNLRNIRNVYVSSNFPKQLLVSVQKAVNEWNRGLGINYYKLSGVISKISSEECLASDGLCIIWNGSPLLAWANYGAMSSIFYDPAVGYIQGGVINIFNLQPAAPKFDVPSDIISKLFDVKSGPYVAGYIWALPQYREYKNPDPAGSITALLIHEMGHDQGFRHYFGGSLSTQPGVPSDTVMDYMPYPYFTLLQKLGSRDIAKISALYRKGNFGSQFSFEMPCSDKETILNPLCNPQDIGDPALYYSSIVNSLGPFFLIKPVGGISGIFGSAKPALEYAARFMIPNSNVTTYQRLIVEQTFCLNAEKDKIAGYLMNSPLAIKLNCSKFRR